MCPPTCLSSIVSACGMVAMLMIVRRGGRACGLARNKENLDGPQVLVLFLVLPSSSP